MSSEDIGGLYSLQVLLQQNPNSLTFGRVADALMKMGRVDEAIQLCEDGLRRHPSYVTGHMVLGKCYLKKKLFDQAEKEFKRVLLFDPKYLAAHKHYGDLMREIGWDNTCEMSYRKIVQIDPLDKGARAVVEELARKSKGEKAEPAPIRRETKPAAEPPPPPLMTVKPIEPVPEDDLFATAETRDNDLLRYQPAAAETDDWAPPAFETKPEPEPEPPSAPARSTPDADEERFSYILDDIFQDEVLDDKPITPAPTNKNSQPPANSRQTFTVESQHEDDFDDNEAAFSASIDSTRDESESPFGVSADDDAPPEERPTAKMQTRPVDFDLDFNEAPPADSFNSEKDNSSKASGFALDGVATNEDKNPARRNSRPAVPSRLPARRPRPLEDQRSQDEPAQLTSPSEREKIVTPTLGEIYAAQGQYTKAIGVFELLSKKEPNNKNYREKIDYLKKRLQETQNAG
jgi:tetratricopeptide (TPR) repeat protein